MFNSSEGYSLSDIAAVSGGNRGGMFGDGFGAGGWWIILLFLFAFGGWGNGWGGYGGGAGNVSADVGYNFDIHDISDGVRDLASGLCNGFANVQTGLMSTQAQIANSGFDTIQAINAGTVSGLQNTNILQSQIAANASQLALANCQTNNNISNGFATLNYNLATEACADRAAITTGARDIIDNANNNTRAILDFLVQDRITALQTENSTLKNQISQSEQNAYLIDALRPAAQPAYLVANPYTGIYGTYGYNALFGGSLSNGFVG